MAMPLCRIELAATNQENLVLNQTEQIVEIETTGEVETMQVASDVAIPDVVNSAISDRDHTIKDVLSRNYRLAEVSWDGSATTGDTLYTAEFPKVLLNKKTTIDKLNNFFGFCAQVRIIIILNTQQFQQGSLLVGLFPNTTGLPGKYLNYSNSLRMMHGGMAKIMRVGQERLEMVLPYTLPQPFVNVSLTPPAFGNLVIKCLTPLNGVGSTSCSFTVMANFENPRPVFPGTNTLSSTQEDLKEVLRKMKPDELKSMMNSARVPQINSDVNNDATKLVTAPNMALVDEKGTSHVVNPTAEKLKKVAMPSLTGADMFLTTLFKIPIIFSKFNVSASSTTSLLWASNVGPQQIVNFTPKLPSGVIETDYIQYISYLFRYWHGNFNFNFHAFKTEYAVVKLRVFFAPGVDAKNASSVDPMQVYSKVVDLNACTNEFSFECPFVSTTPVLGTDASIGCIGVMFETKLNYASVTVPDNFDIIVTRSSADLHFGGIVGIKHKPYTIPASFKSKPEIKLSNIMATSDNMSVGEFLKISTKNFSAPPSVNSSNNINYSSFGSTVDGPNKALDYGGVNDIVHHISGIPIAETQGAKITSLSTIYSMPLTASVSVWNETTKSQIDLTAGDTISMQFTVDNVAAPTTLTYTKFLAVKGTYAYDLTVCDDDFNKINFPLTTPFKDGNSLYFLFPDGPVTPVLPSAQWCKIYPSRFTVDTNDIVDYLDYFSLMYAYYRGGVKLRVNSESSMNVTAMMDIGERVGTKNLTWFQPTSSDVLATAGLPSQLMSLPVEGFVDIEVPFYSRYPYHSARLDNVQGAIPMIFAPSTSPKVWEIYRSGDEDFEFSLLLGPPLVQLNS